MQHYTYKTRGTCSRQIDFDSDGKIVKNVKFTNGCSGNTQGVGILVDGMEVERVIKLLENVDCNGRGTSCPAQLALALKDVVNGD